MTLAKSKVFGKLLSSAKTKDEPQARAGHVTGMVTMYKQEPHRVGDSRARRIPKAECRPNCVGRADDSKFGLTTPGHLYYIYTAVRGSVCVTGLL